MHLLVFKIIVTYKYVYSDYNQQVEHVSSCANKTNKKHEVACKGIELQFFTLQNSAQYSASCLQKKKSPQPNKIKAQETKNL
jgi:hypothetical protein